jgi:hypothetical protein
LSCSYLHCTTGQVAAVDDGGGPGGVQASCKTPVVHQDGLTVVRR